MIYHEFLSTTLSTDCDNIDWDLQYLSDSQLSVIDRISSKPEFHVFGDIADVKIGIVKERINSFASIKRS